MFTKKILAGFLGAALALSLTTTTNIEAASREELGNIKVTKSAKFKCWTKDSAAKQALVKYVKDVTNPKSPNFIPKEDRLAVFDNDGTMYCETSPFYVDSMMYIYRMLEDPTYTPSKEDRAFAQEYKQAVLTHTLTYAQEDRMVVDYAKSLDGMTPAEFAKFTERYINNTNVQGLSNLKVGEAFYMPMVEVVSYLNNNSFTVYIVSACERDTLRTLVKGVMDIKSNHIIGTDYTMRAEKQGSKAADSYNLGKEDKLVRGGQVWNVDLKMNKVIAIHREIGKVPVLAFGNSNSDASMMNYAVRNSQYKGAAFVVLCDDMEREFGKAKSATRMEKLAAENGWHTISMKNDFATIYGDKVTKAGS